MTNERKNMSPEEALKNLQAYFDGELAENERRAIETMLETDNALKAELDALKALRRAIKSAPQPAASEALRRRILDRARASASVPPLPPRAEGGEQARVEQAPTRRRGRIPRRTRWLSAAAILIMIVGAGYIANKSFQFFDLNPFAKHVEAGLSEYASIHDTGYFKPKFGFLASENPKEIEDFIAEHTDFAPKLPDLGDKAKPTRAYFCTVRGKKTAIVRYVINAVDTSLYVHPAQPENDQFLIDRAAGRPAKLPSANGYKIIIWRENGFDYALAVYETQLDRVMDAIF